MSDHLTNPAGRLHQALSAYELLRPGASPLGAWASVFAVPESAVEVAPFLAELSAQVPRLRAALVHMAPRQLENFDSYAHHIYAPLLGVGVALSHHAAQPVDVHALRWLSTAADLLEGRTISRKIPGDEDRTELRTALEAARDAVRTETSNDLRPDLRLHLLDLIDQAIHALDYIDIAGPDGVMAVVDQMVLRGAMLPADSAARPALGTAVTKVYRAIEAAVVVSEFTQLVEAASRLALPGAGG